jgi:hypothetical protein
MDKFIIGGKTMKKQIEFTMYKNQLLISIILFLAGLTMFSSGQTSSAQVIRTGPTPPLVRRTPPQVRRTPPPAQKIIVFKGTGTQQQLPKFERSEQVRAPAALTLPEKQNLFNEALRLNGVAQGVSGVIPFADLSVRTPYFENKAYINFYELYATYSKDNAVLYRNINTPKILWLMFIKPTKTGQWFLIDCPLNVYGAAATFQIRGPDENIAAETTIMGDGRIQAFLIAQNINWQVLSFITKGIQYEATLFPCEITKKD